MHTHGSCNRRFFYRPWNNPVKPEWADHFKLTTEDFLHSVITLVNELARLCPNAIVNADFTLPLTISKFCKEVHAGFGLLNLKNDALRKRFDGMKVSDTRRASCSAPTTQQHILNARLLLCVTYVQYDIKKMEEGEHTSVLSPATSVALTNVALSCRNSSRLRHLASWPRTVRCR